MISLLKRRSRIDSGTLIHRIRSRETPSRERFMKSYTALRAQKVAERLAFELKTPVKLEERIKTETRVDNLLKRHQMGVFVGHTNRLTDTALLFLMKRLRCQEKNRRFKTY